MGVVCPLKSGSGFVRALAYTCICSSGRCHHVPSRPPCPSTSQSLAGRLSSWWATRLVLQLLIVPKDRESGRGHQGHAWAQWGAGNSSFAARTGPSLPAAGAQLGPPVAGFLRALPSLPSALRGRLTLGPVGGDCVEVVPRVPSTLQAHSTCSVTVGQRSLGC